MTRRPPHRAVVSVQVQVPVSNETPSDYGRLRPKPSTHRRSHWGPPVSKTIVCCDWDTSAVSVRASRRNDAVTCLENQS